MRELLGFDDVVIVVTICCWRLSRAVLLDRSAKVWLSIYYLDLSNAYTYIPRQSDQNKIAQFCAKANLAASSRRPQCSHEGSLESALTVWELRGFRAGPLVWTVTKPWQLFSSVVMSAICFGWLAPA